MTLPPCTFVLFGATGDLAQKKLIPALYRMHVKEVLPEETHIIAIGRREYSDQELQKRYKQFIDKNVFSRKRWASFCKRICYHRIEGGDDEGYDQLNKILKRQKNVARKNRLFYLATPQKVFGEIIEQLGRTGLADRDPKDGWHRVIIEKPFGSNLRSARKLNKEICRLFHESQIYRIDHYIGKRFVQQILSLRFANPLLENQWNSKYIEAVEIAISEDHPVGERGNYYDSSGAIRDMMQNHLMQLLSLVAMEPPSKLESEKIRSAKAKVLRAVRLQSKAELKHTLVLGQYTKGKIGRKQVPAYTSEEGVDSKSRTETYAAAKLAVDTKRWRGVPFYLWTGKALDQKYAEIRVWFRLGSWLKIPDAEKHVPRNSFVIRIQPEEGLRMTLNFSDETDQFSVESEVLDFTKEAEYGLNSRGAYELLLTEAIRGDQTLFTRWDFVESAWKITDNLRKGARVVHRYKAGSKGPFAGLRLLKHNTHLFEDNFQ